MINIAGRRIVNLTKFGWSGIFNILGSGVRFGENTGRSKEESRWRIYFGDINWEKSLYKK